MGERWAKDSLGSAGDGAEMKIKWVRRDPDRLLLVTSPQNRASEYGSDPKSRRC